MYKLRAEVAEALIQLDAEVAAVWQQRLLSLQ
jgi:hypothetical protein